MTEWKIHKSMEDLIEYFYSNVDSYHYGLLKVLNEDLIKYSFSTKKIILIRINGIIYKTFFQAKNEDGLIMSRFITK